MIRPRRNPLVKLHAASANDRQNLDYLWRKIVESRTVIEEALRILDSTRRAIAIVKRLQKNFEDQADEH
jgi:hypothetical protein